MSAGRKAGTRWWLSSAPDSRGNASSELPPVYSRWCPLCCACSSSCVLPLPNLLRHSLVRSYLLRPCLVPLLLRLTTFGNAPLPAVRSWLQKIDGHPIVAYLLVS